MVTWLAKVAMVARVVMGVAREQGTVPRLDTPAETHAMIQLRPKGGRWPPLSVYLWFP